MAYTGIDNPGEYFNTKLYSGSGSASNITGVGFQPDWVWIKCRTNAVSHSLNDSVRGANKQLESNDTGAETSFTNALTTFGSDGFTVDTSGETGQSGRTYVSWNWYKDSTAGFDIVSWAGNATNRTISHSLSAVPTMMIVKNRSAATSWIVYHHKNTTAPQTDHLKLDTNDATSDDDSMWNDTAPTSSVLSLKTSTSVNGNSANYIGYIFTDIKGFSKSGSYIGNGAAAIGPHIFLGFKPAFIIIKSSSNADDWRLVDNKRSTGSNGNPRDQHLFAHTTGTDSGSSSDGVEDGINFLSNGFQIRQATNGYNGSGRTYIYMAWAESPVVNSNGIPNLAE